MSSSTRLLKNLDKLNTLSIYLLETYSISLETFLVFSRFICQSNITNSFNGLLMFLEFTSSFFFYFNFFNIHLTSSSVTAHLYNISKNTFFSVGDIIVFNLPVYRDK